MEWIKRYNEDIPEFKMGQAINNTDFINKTTGKHYADYYGFVSKNDYYFIWMLIVHRDYISFDANTVKITDKSKTIYFKIENSNIQQFVKKYKPGMQILESEKFIVPNR
jgi:hypothetical protein